MAPTPWPGTFTTPKMAFYLFVFLISLCQSVLSTAMFVGQVGLFAKISDPRIGGTYMTFLNTVANLAFKWSQSSSYFIVDALTSKDAEQKYIVDGFYPFAVVASLIGLVWAYATRKTIQEIEQSPMSMWKVKTSASKEKKDSDIDEAEEGQSLLLPERR